MSSRSIKRQRKSFDDLVDSGVYSAVFEHAPPAKVFVEDVLSEILRQFDRQKPLNILDCGCGTGTWLAFIHAHLSQRGVSVHRFCGFDLSSGMVEVAQQTLQGVADPNDIRCDNVLDKDCFAFYGVEQGFDLIFTYDVVQQLPRARQLDACRAIADQLAPGGIALIFDNDSETKFGRRMGVRKFLTRYFRIPLVPRYYCNAAYPPLEKFRLRLDGVDNRQAKILVRADRKKRTLVIERSNISVS